MLVYGFGQKFKFSIFFDFFKILLFLVLKSFVFVREYSQTHFPRFFCVREKDTEFSIFWPKPWTNAFVRLQVSNA